jgi:hypothetical protein
MAANVGQGGWGKPGRGAGLWISESVSVKRHYEMLGKKKDDGDGAKSSILWSKGHAFRP